MSEIKRENAIQMHKDFFSGEFDIAPFEYSALMDVRPWSSFYPMWSKRILGNWTGFICADANKIVISKVSGQDIKRTWEINSNELVEVKMTTFSRLKFTKKFKGLTNYGKLDTLLLLGYSIFPLPLMIFWYSRKTVICRIHDDYSNKFEMGEFLKKQASKPTYSSS